MWGGFTVRNETAIDSAIGGWVIPLSRSNTIWMRSRCAAGIFHRSAVFSSRICFLVHLTIRLPESDSQSESYPAPSRDPEKRQKSLDSNSYGSGIRTRTTPHPETIPGYAGNAAPVRRQQRVHGLPSVLRWHHDRCTSDSCRLAVPSKSAESGHKRSFTW